MSLTHPKPESVPEMLTAAVGLYEELRAKSLSLRSDDPERPAIQKRFRDATNRLMRLLVIHGVPFQCQGWNYVVNKGDDELWRLPPPSSKHICSRVKMPDVA